MYLRFFKRTRIKSSFIFFILAAVLTVITFPIPNPFGIILLLIGIYKVVKANNVKFYGEFRKEAASHGYFEDKVFDEDFEKSGDPDGSSSLRIGKVFTYINVCQGKPEIILNSQIIGMRIKGQNDGTGLRYFFTNFFTSTFAGLMVIPVRIKSNAFSLELTEFLIYVKGREKPYVARVLCNELGINRIYRAFKEVNPEIEIPYFPG